MKKLIIIILLLPMMGLCQQVQWVSKVIKSSSDLGGKQYSSRRVIGKPDVFPQGGDSPNAWAPKNAQDGHDFIEVEFEKAQTVKQIAIFENLNTGCLVKVLLGTGDGKYNEVVRSSLSYLNIDMGIFQKAGAEGRSYYFGRRRRKVAATSDVNNKPGIEYAKLSEPVENVKSLRVVFNFKKTEGDKQIDAIGISDSDTPIIAEINTRKDFENLGKPEVVFTSNNYFGFNLIKDNKIYLDIEENKISKIHSLDIVDGKLQNLTPLPSSLNKNPEFNYLAGIAGSKFIVGGSPYKRGTSETGYFFYNQSGNEYIQEKPLQIVAYNNFADVSDLTTNKDRSYIIVSAESDLSQGGMDLYFAKAKEDGTYSILQNLGKNINSANDEFLPFLCDDEKTLIFASNGISGYGSEDLYYTLRLDDTWKKWSEPINLGPIINDANPQSSFVYDSKNEVLYYRVLKDDKYQILSLKLPKSYFNGN
ncbi:MAG: hypothetical protein ABIP95_16135 [Pelobium sp.]